MRATTSDITLLLVAVETPRNKEIMEGTRNAGTVKTIRITYPGHNRDGAY